MSNNYLFTFKPTFTQGLVLGQLSVLILTGLVLRYLFLESTQYPLETSSYLPRVDNDLLSRRLHAALDEKMPSDGDQDAEPAEWFNVLFKQVSKYPFCYEMLSLFSGIGHIPAKNKRRVAWH